MFENAAIIGVGQSASTRSPEPGQTALHFMRDAVVAALKDAGLKAKDIQGMAVASFSLAPDSAVDLAWKLGLSLRWLAQDTNGGSSGMSMLGNALRTVETGTADVVLILGGDATGLAGYAKVAANYNTATQKHLWPIRCRATTACRWWRARRRSSSRGPTARRRAGRAFASAPIVRATTTTTRRATACRPASAPSPTSSGRRPARGRTTSTLPRSTTIIRPWCWRRPTISDSFQATTWRASAG